MITTSMMTSTANQHRTSYSNPFDDDNNDDDAPAAASSSNPFDHHRNNAEEEGDTLENHNHNHDDNDDDAPTGEASWMYLGDIPYRRVPVYTNVKWAFQQQQQTRGDPSRTMRRTTRLLVAGCPHGGYIATIVVPILLHDAAAASASSNNKNNKHVGGELCVQSNAGAVLAELRFPPPAEDNKAYTTADILAMGFTTRSILVIVMKDSLCFTYDCTLQPILPPFFILPGTGSTLTELQHASIFDGGVAVLAKNKHSAIVELLDDHDDVQYLQQAHVSARTVPASLEPSSHSTTTTANNTLPPHYALITPLPTAVYASEHFLSYLTLAVLSRTRTGSHPEVLLSTADHSVIICQTHTTEIQDVNCRAKLSSPIVDMAIAPNGRFLACFTESAMLTVLSTSFDTKVLDFDTSQGSSLPPLTMQWCGEDSVVLHWKNLGCLMVGPFGDWLRYPYDDDDDDNNDGGGEESSSSIYLLPEIDGCRVMTESGRIEILQRVPPMTALLLRLGSIETSAMLLDAADAFYAGTPGSDAVIRAMEPAVLVEAVQVCLDAAAKEWNVSTQKRLLRAASYGMQFTYKTSETMVMGGPTKVGSELDTGVLPSTLAVKFVETSRKIRVLNQLRNPKVGWVLTSAQYDAITPTGVVARLCMMKRPALAVAVSQYLRLPQSVQLYARARKASAIVEADKTLSDSELAEAAIKVITGDGVAGSAACLNRGGYATVAMAASKAGRPGVADLLLMLESSVADKVPTLLANGSYADAVAVATTHRDADFIFSIVMDYERSCMSSTTLGDPASIQDVVYATVASKFTPEAFHMFRRYLLATSTVVKNATILLIRAQRFTDAGSTIALRAMAEADGREKQGMLIESSRVFGLGKETAFPKSCTDDQIDLLKDIETVKTKYASIQMNVDGASIIGLISALIHAASSNEREQHRLLADVDKVARKYKVSEKRLWAVKVKAFADTKQWSNLRMLAETKGKSPIGYKQFARAVIRGKQPVSEIMRYVNRVTVPEEKYDLLIEAKLWKDALEEAYKLKDGRRIINVKGLCNDTDLQIVADQMLGRLA